MTFKDIQIFAKERYSIEQDTVTGKFYLSFPVFNGMAEYEEYYEILPEEMEVIMKDESARKALLEKSRNRQNDDRLLLKPGRLRGSPC